MCRFLNSSDESFAEAKLPLKTPDYVVITYFSILFFVGFLGNIIVLIGMFCNYSHMITSSHIFAIHMAVADLLLIMVLPIHIVEYRDHLEWKMGSFLCVVCKTLKAMNFFVSIFLLTLMAADRYIAIVGKYRPVAFKQKPPKIAHCLSETVFKCFFIRTCNLVAILTQ